MIAHCVLTTRGLTTFVLALMRDHRELAHWPFYANPNGVNRILYSACNAGLANRLYVLAGCSRIAKITGRNLALYWPVNGSDGVGCEFKDLFSTNIHMMSDWDVHWIFDTAHSVKLYNPSDAHSIGRADSHDIIIIRSWEDPSFQGEPPAAGEIDGFIRGLVLSGPAQAAVDNAVSRVAPGSIGVHVRRADACFNKPLDPFFARLDCTSKPIFLSTDTHEVQDQFLNRYGTRLHFHQKTESRGVTDRGTLNGMIEALCDLYSLASTDEIIGTCHSRFTQLAGALGNKQPSEL